MHTSTRRHTHPRTYTLFRGAKFKYGFLATCDAQTRCRMNVGFPFNVAKTDRSTYGPKAHVCANNNQAMKALNRPSSKPIPWWIFIITVPRLGVVYIKYISFYIYIYRCDGRRMCMYVYVLVDDWVVGVWVVGGRFPTPLGRLSSWKTFFPGGRSNWNAFSRIRV